MQENASGLGEALRQAAAHARRAVVGHAVATVAANGGTVPSPHALSITFETRYEGVELSYPSAGELPERVTVVLQETLQGLRVDEAAFTVDLPLDGRMQRLRVPYLAVRAFADPPAGCTIEFDAVPAEEREYAQSVLETAMELLDPATAHGPLDHAGTERNVSRVVVCVALARLEGGTEPHEDEQYLITIDPGHAGVTLPEALAGRGAGPVTLSFGRPVRGVRAGRQAFEAKVPAGGGLASCVVPYRAVTEFSAPATGLSWRFTPAAPASPPQGRRPLMDRFIGMSGHHIHKLKAKDTTGQWAYYFVYVPPVRERDFLAALNKGDGTIDIEDYGNVVASCYGEQPTAEVKAYLKERYGFDV